MSIWNNTYDIIEITGKNNWGLDGRVCMVCSRYFDCKQGVEETSGGHFWMCGKCASRPIRDVKPNRGREE